MTIFCFTLKVLLPIIRQFFTSGNFQRGDVYGEDSRICYNIENPSIDLEAYAQGYSGLALLYRLRFIAHHCPVLRVEALKLAISHVMNTHNTGLYNELHKKLGKIILKREFRLSFSPFDIFNVMLDFSYSVE